MKSNLTITKLGVKTTDPNSRDCIQRYTIRNNDRARRRKSGGGQADDETIAETKHMGYLLMMSPPQSGSPASVFTECEFGSVICAYCAEKLQVPTREQLQSFARTQNQNVPFAKASPAMKAFTTKLLDAVVGVEASIADEVGKE